MKSPRPVPIYDIKDWRSFCDITRRFMMSVLKPQNKCFHNYNVGLKKKKKMWQQTMMDWGLSQTESEAQQGPNALSKWLFPLCQFDFKWRSSFLFFFISFLFHCFIHSTLTFYFSVQNKVIQFPKVMALIAT